MRLLLLIGGTLIGVLVAELFARIPAFPSEADLLFNSPDSSPMGLYVLDKQTRQLPAKNFQTQARALGTTVALRTNELQLRGPPSKTIQGEQWLAVGDSFTMSVQVSEEDSFQGQLGSQKKVYIWNGGVDGYSTWQAGLRYDQVRHKIPIQTVILTFFTGNDFQDNERFLFMRTQPLPGKNGDPIPRRKIPAWKLFLLQHSYLYAHARIFQHRRSLVSNQKEQARNWRDELSIFSKVGQQRLQNLTKNSRDALQDLKRRTLRGRSKLLVAIAPPAFVVDQKRAKATFELVGIDQKDALLDAPQQAIQQVLQQLNIPYCDLTSSLKKSEQEQPTYLKTDGHWTIHGHKTVAQTLHQCLSKP
ncbi:MAG: hypothetical protein VX278_22110 [Myxococcota bacterium]|nr:hypothetical protein [Myxococcota bacterium]